MTNYRRLSVREKKDILQKEIEEHPEGIRMKQLMDKVGMSWVTLSKYLKMILEEERVRLVDYGRLKLYKPLNTEDAREE